MGTRHVASGRVVVAGVGQMARPALLPTRRSAAHGRAWLRAALRCPWNLRTRRITAMLDKAADTYIENRTFDELTVGETASSSHTVTQRDIDLFATVTG